MLVHASVWIMEAVQPGQLMGAMGAGALADPPHLQQLAAIGEQMELIVGGYREGVTTHDILACFEVAVKGCTTGGWDAAALRCERKHMAAQAPCLPPCTACRSATYAADH